MRLQLPELRQVLDPAVADGIADVPGQARIGQHHPAPRRHAIGLVGELRRAEFVEVAQHVGLQQFGVQRGDAIDGMAADAGQVGHAHVALAALVDQAHSRDAGVVAEPAVADLVEEAGVDLVDDFQMARQHALEQGQRPALQRFRQQRVIGVAEGLAGDLPGLLPAHGVLVGQEPHQLGDGDRRMGVVELGAELLVEAFQRQLLDLHDPQHVLQRARHEEVLLGQPQFLALDVLVIRVEHLRQVLRHHLLADRALIVAAVELGKVEGFRRFRLPQPQRVRGVVAIAEDRRVVGDSHHRAVRHPAHVQPALFIPAALGAAAELHFRRPLRPAQLPGIAVAQPLVGLLDLPAIDDLLVEDAELVADAVADRRDFQCRQRVDEAGREAAETAVAEARFLFLVEQVVEVQPQFLHRLAGRVGQAEIDQVVAQMRAHQEFGREIGDGSRAALLVLVGGRDPALQQPVADGVGQCQVVVGLGRQRRELALRVEQVVQEGVAQPQHRLVRQIAEATVEFLRHGIRLVHAALRRWRCFGDGMLRSSKIRADAAGPCVLFLLSSRRKPGPSR